MALCFLAAVPCFDRRDKCARVATRVLVSFISPSLSVRLSLSLVQLGDSPLSMRGGSVWIWPLCWSEGTLLESHPLSLSQRHRALSKSLWWSLAARAICSSRPRKGGASSVERSRTQPGNRCARVPFACPVLLLLLARCAPSGISILFVELKTKSAERDGRDWRRGPSWSRVTPVGDDLWQRRRSLLLPRLQRS